MGVRGRRQSAIALPIFPYFTRVARLRAGFQPDQGYHIAPDRDRSAVDVVWFRRVYLLWPHSAAAAQ